MKNEITHLTKNGHTYIIKYVPDKVKETYRQLWDWSADPEHSLDWVGVAMMQSQLQSQVQGTRE